MRSLAFFLALFLTSGLFAQTCASPPTCLENSLLIGEPGGLMIDAPHEVAGWYVSHGAPFVASDDSPSVPNGSSVAMLAGDGKGSGMFACFDFQPDTEYRLCLWVRNLNPISEGGHLQIWMANGLTPMFDPDSLPPSLIPDGQLVDSAWSNNMEWTHLQFTVTPQAAYTQLLIYPHMPGPLVDGIGAYQLQVDDIRVTPIYEQTFELTVTASQPTSELAWCDSMYLYARGAPEGAVVAWYPSDDLETPFTDTIRVSPCGDRTYTATSEVPGACFFTCDGVLAWASVGYTVHAVPPTVPLFATPPSICGTDQWLYAEVPEGICASMTRWVDMQGNVTENDSLLVPDLDADYLGPYVFEVIHPTGNCVARNNTFTVDPVGTKEWFYMPNAFSPDGDGINDVFFGYTRHFTGGFAAFDLSILDRWGRVIHNTTDADKGWDGTAGGKQSPIGVYAYVVDFTLDCDKRSQRRTGHVTLVR